MLHSAALLDGWMSTREALERLVPYSDGQYVVIRTREELRLFWFSMLKADVVQACSNVEQNFGRGAETPVGSVLKLKNSQARNVFDLARVRAPELRRASGILVNGRQFLGVITPDAESELSEELPPAVPEPEPPGPQSPPPEEQEAAVEDRAKDNDARSESPVVSPVRSKAPPGLFQRVVTMMRLDRIVGSSNRRPTAILGGGEDGSASGALGSLLGKVLGGASTKSEPPRSASGSEPPTGSSGADHGSAAEESGGDDASGGSRGGLNDWGGGGTRGGSAGDTGVELEVDEARSADSSSPLDENDAGSEGSVKDDVVYPNIDAPERVDVDVPFDFTVSLTEERAAAVTHAPLNFSGVAENDDFELHILLSATGFTVEGPSLRPFPVTRLNYALSTETFVLTPTGELDSPSIQKINVQFFYKGNPVGGAYQEVAVGAPAQEELHGGSTAVRTDLEQKAPDLTVFIDEANQSGHLAWTLESPHPIDAALKKQVDVRLGEHNGQSFALSLINGIPSRDHRRALVQTLRGAGRNISRVIPKNFWDALAAVWRMMDEGEVPRVLIISVDPHVPWELATLEEPFFDQELLDENCPKILCAQVIVGRWLVLDSDVSNARFPTLPPPVKVSSEKMAVIVGDYLAKNGVRPLPEAEEEGNDLINLYSGVRLSAVEEDILDLLDNAVKVDEQPVSISLMHFACHGVFNPTRPEQSGIVLNNNTRFDPMWAAGNSIGSQTQPFAFMNACQVGSAGEALGSYGGFAGAFINEGFSGFMAPLWDVNDTDARQFALAFYAKTMHDNKTIGEALRELRAGLMQDPDKPASTYVAYILYAHPDLRFELISGG